MKKSYTKPQLWAESFQPSDAIAGPCDVDVNFSDTDITRTCSYTVGPGTKIFVQSLNSECEFDWNLEEHGDAGCYHNPNGDRKFFGS